MKNLERSWDKVSLPLLNLLDELAAGRIDWPLFLHGQAGTGKTCAALCLCDLCHQSQYYTMEDLADLLIEGGKYDWGRIAERRLIVVDEIGTRAKTGDLHYHALKKVADLRGYYPTIYISNCEPAELGLIFDDRIASRLLCGSIFNLVDDDRRMQ